jgi:hypothetical protein
MTAPVASREVAIIGGGPPGAPLAYELLQGGDRSFEEIKPRFRPDIFLRQLLVKSARNQPIA